MRLMGGFYFAATVQLVPSQYARMWFAPPPVTVLPQVLVVESLTAPRDPSVVDEQTGRLEKVTGPEKAVTAIEPPLAALEWL